MLRPYAARRVPHPLGSADVYWTASGEVVIGRVDAGSGAVGEEWTGWGWFDDREVGAAPPPRATHSPPQSRPAPRAARPKSAAAPPPRGPTRAQKAATRAAEERAAALRTLGLAEGATPAEARRRYHELAHERHPDRGGTVRQMADLNAAWEKLRR